MSHPNTPDLSVNYNETDIFAGEMDRIHHLILVCSGPAPGENSTTDEVMKYIIGRIALLKKITLLSSLYPPNDVQVFSTIKDLVARGNFDELAKYIIELDENVLLATLLVCNRDLEVSEQIILFESLLKLGIEEAFPHIVEAYLIGAEYKKLLILIVGMPKEEITKLWKKYKFFNLLTLALDVQYVPKLYLLEFYAQDGDTQMLQDGMLELFTSIRDSQTQSN